MSNIIRSELVSVQDRAPVRQVSQASGNEMLEKVLQRLEQLELQVARAAQPAARERGPARAGAARARDGRSDAGRPDGGRQGCGRRACFACGSEQHLRAACPHRRARCYTCGRDGHISRVCDRGNDAGVTVSRSANQCPQPQNPPQ